MKTAQLRTRLAIAGLLLFATTLAIGLWSATAFRRVSRVVSDTVTANQRITDATASLSNALEREDDAVVLVLNDVPNAVAQVNTERLQVTAALARIDDPVLRADVILYETAVDELLDGEHGAREINNYRHFVNPLLRQAEGTIERIRDDHFASSQRVAEWAGVQSTRSMQIVATISGAALLMLLLVVLHFARAVVGPVVEMTRVVQAIRRGDFSQRVTSERDDELGRLGTGLSRMADELEEFKRTNIGEVIHAKETLEATLGAFPDAVLVIDEARNITAANPRAQAALPLPEPTRAVVEEVLTTGIVPPLTVDLRKTIELTIDGQPRRLLPRIVPIADGRGAVLVLSDVTELARLDERRLELVAVASHELRTPLTTMRMTLSMLSEHAVHYSARDRELVSTAMLGVEQLSALVDEFLDLTRIEAGQLRLHWTRVAARELVDSAIKTAAPAAEQANVTLEVVHAPEAPSDVPGDPGRIAMVLSNLLTNAIKYTPAGGRVQVRTSGTPGELTIEVSDTGPGIPAEFRERVFERFFRVEHAKESAPPSAGVGIGLYIARQVIELHGGTIRCDAGPLGGARFAFTIGKIPGHALANDPASSG